MIKINDTLLKFGYPDTVVQEYENWCIVLRPEQVTLGSMILICKDDVNKFSNISNDAFQEYPFIIKVIENTLFNLFAYDKINYLMLMMEDPTLHYHVIPRYKNERVVVEKIYKDTGYPGIPDLKYDNNCNEDESLRIKKMIIG